MLAKTINAYLQRRPFIPFRIEKTGGVWYDIPNPAMASATRDAIELGFSLENDKQMFVTISLVHVISVEILLPVAVS